MKKALLILGIILLVVLLEPIFAMVLGFDQLEMVTYDMRAKVALDKGPFAKKFKHADKKIVIVAIDDFSKKELANHPELDLGSWPWRRDVWAQVVDFIEQGEPKVVLFDLIFNDINYGYSYDRTFANALRKYDNVVLATSLNDPKKVIDNLSPENKKRVEIANSDFVPTGKSLDVNIENKRLDNDITYYSHAPLYNFYTRYNTIGVVNKVSSYDSVIRATQPIFKLIKGDETYYMPSLSFAGFLKAVGGEGSITIKNNKLFYRGREIPINDDGTVPISWHGVGSGGEYEYVHISKLLLNKNGESDLKPDYFKDKIVIIGRTEAGTDIHASSVDTMFPGPEVNATAIDNFLNDTDLNNAQARKIITTMPFYAECLLTLFFCLFIVFVGAVSKNALFSFFNSFLLILFYVLICIYFFVDPSLRIWVSIVAPLYYILATAVIVYSFRLHDESAKKYQVINMFGKFVSPKVLSSLMKNPDKLVLKNSKKHITIMFCDVKDFTSLSEKCNPEQLVENLNELFNLIVDIIFENNGTVDKFVGDCVMAYWGDPIASEDDPYMAVKTALEIKKKVDELKIANIKDGKIVFDVKIGINTGDALLGLAGSDKIMSYTAMGDAVNTAARLEASCSRLERDVLISKATFDQVKEKIVAMEVGTIKLKGKDEHIEVYEPIGFVEKSEE